MSIAVGDVRHILCAFLLSNKGFNDCRHHSTMFRFQVLSVVGICMSYIRLSQTSLKHLDPHVLTQELHRKLDSPPRQRTRGKPEVGSPRQSRMFGRLQQTPGAPHNNRLERMSAMRTLKRGGSPVFHILAVLGSTDSPIPKDFGTHRA